MKIRLKSRILAVLMCGVMALLCACEAKEESSSQTDTQGNLLDNLSSSDAVSDGDYYNKPFTNPETDAKVIVEGTDFTVNGKKIWFNSVNTPWDKWNDFGGGFNEVFWDNHFAELKKAGVNATRIWINCNGLVGVLINEDGSFGSVTDKHWQDLDKLFELAAKHKIYIMATLLSFDHFKDGNDGVQNWRNMITDSNNIDGFVEGYVVPFVKRYDGNDYLWSIDLMNEPDWVYKEEGNGFTEWDNISNYFARAAAAIHENSDVLVTAGFGVIKYNSDKYQGNKGSDEYLKSLSGNEKSYLDFYSTHFYQWQNQWFGSPFTQSPEDFGLDGTKPCVIGECASLDNGKLSITEKYEKAYENGWDGVFAWTSNGVDDCGGFYDVAPATENMLEKIPELIFPLGE